MKPSYQTLAVAFGLVLLAWIGCFSGGMPSLIRPLPMMTTIPAFVLSSPPFRSSSYLFAVLVPALLFIAWHPGLFRGKCEIPIRTFVLLTVLSILSVIYFVSGWNDGKQYQGREYTIVICAMNVVWLVSLWILLYGAYRLRVFKTNLLFHAVLFAWLAWYGFPYLGELP
jgi:hypothetical protein